MSTPSAAPKRTQTKRALGQYYERLAEAFLVDQGAHIIDRNTTYKGGELDLIVWLEAHLVFVEVRYRHEADHGHPLETITPTKQQRLLKAARIFLQKHPQLHAHPMRFDIVFFLGNEQPQWLKNAIVSW